MKYQSMNNATTLSMSISGGLWTSDKIRKQEIND